jgi:hypothetical protein
MPAKSAESVKIRANQWLKMKKSLKNIENVVISVQKITQMRSTPVENVRQIRLFMQNKSNFLHFSPENEDFDKKQTQFKPNQSQFWPKNRGSKANSNPNKPNSTESWRA